MDKILDVIFNIGYIFGLVVLFFVVIVLLVVLTYVVWVKMFVPSIEAIKREREYKQRYLSEINNPETSRHYSKTNTTNTKNIRSKKRRPKMKREKKNFYDKTNRPFTTIPGYVYLLLIVCVAICIVVNITNTPATDVNAISTETTDVVIEMPESTPVPTEPPIVKEPIVEPAEPVYVPLNYTQDELENCKWIVEAEAHGLSLHHKTLIMCVLVNRMNSDLWNYDDLNDVIFDKNQFPSTYNIYSRKLVPDDDTITAVESVLNGIIDPEEYADGAVFFYNPDRCGGKISFFENRTFLYSLDGHRFFR